MEEHIKNFFDNETSFSDVLKKRYYDKLKKYDDIFAEFSDWVQTREFKNEGALKVSGYSVLDLNQINPRVMKGVTPFLMLVDLRDKPEAVQEYIKNRFEVL